MGALRVRPEAQYKDADRIGLDGLPHVGAVVWPQQAYYATMDRMTCESVGDACVLGDGCIAVHVCCFSGSWCCLGCCGLEQNWKSSRCQHESFDGLSCHGLTSVATWCMKAQNARLVQAYQVVNVIIAFSGIYV